MPVDLSRVVWLDLLLFVVLVAFTLLGAWRGALESALRLGGWIAGYAAAILAAPRAGDAAAALLGTPAWLGMPLAGAFAFLAVQIVFAVAIVLARRRREESEPGSADRFLGGLFGAVRGGLLVVVAGWLALFAEAFWSQALASQAPALESSRAARWSGALVESGAGAVLGDDDPAARAATALVARPRETLAALQDVLGHPRMIALQGDAAFWSRLERGDVRGALAQPSARALTGDVELRARLAALGLVDPEVASDRLAFERALGEALAAAAPRIAAVRNSPELRALLEDPQVQDLVERGDTVGLLVHPRFRSVLRRATES